MKSYRVLTLILLGATSFACTGHSHEAEGWTKEDLAELEAKWGQNYAFSGISTFANLEHTRCLLNPRETFDIAIVGAPYDTSVGYRPGARFGPRAIRHVSGRQSSFRGFNPRAGINPYQSWAKIIDCGDIPVTPFDNVIAQEQMTQALKQLGRHQTVSGVSSRPKLLTLGGDHSLSLPALRALNEVHDRPIQVLHFDAHLDTWHPEAYPSYWGTTHFTHGSMFWMAYQEGLLCNSSSRPSVHAGLRSRLGGTGWKDNDEDAAQNWLRIPADEIDNIGTRGIINQILGMLGTEQPVYLSVDIDVLDPAFAPGTGTPEPGGWSSRELISILRGLEDLNLVGADVVEVSPPYQNRGEETSFAAAQVVYELLTSMIKRGLKDLAKEKSPTSDDKDEL
ncbi:arginase family-domain-containing protein [Penicillium mononematosum]|uniref:arginase family-domain-containing protein n=1 Tax=Penicillium mononematosum TaxID=268346 RepID=UPI0025495401|nr:arginase family-domain-containing protein [Penicillium mononematosum]KAJ6183589.1 arginase family-domain-containing protein [Penicillium mononematosum]